jgi:serine/threonine protein kinase/DNA-binding CsgD family transcriptional regulator
MIGHKLRNRYEIREHLGDGSTATVYKAFDERLEREVAIKMLLPHVRESTRKRFFQEATSAAKLNHPNIMAIFDIDQEGDRHFLVVEYVDGLSLSAYVPSSPEVIVDLGSQIANALQYAHERQIIHRDIKPANIKVTPAGQVKLMDLGLALPHDAKRVTAHGMVIGTPAYLSPEQAQGMKLDNRTDIYSLGIVLYEMATGQLPFNADDIGALLLQQVKQAAPPLRNIVPTLPVALENVILKSLEKNANRRYQSGAALASALESALNPSAEDVQPIDVDTAHKRPAWADTLQTAAQKRDSGTRKRTLRLILADDHTILRKSLANLLETHEEFVIVAEAGDGESALQQTVSIVPDVLLLDLNMPIRSGLDILPEIRKTVPSVKVLILTGREEDAYIVRALRAGAHGYILKSADESDLVEGLKKVAQGQLVLGRGVAEKIVGGVLSDQAPDSVRLTDSDQKVLLQIASGKENEQISKELNIPLIELIEQIANIMKKLGSKDRYATALKALREGYILLDDLHDIDRLV